MDDQPLGQFEYGSVRAEIYSTNLPGEFNIVYRDASGKVLEQGLLTGVSTYRQRESEIMDRLKELSKGEAGPPSADLTSSGEY